MRSCTALAGILFTLLGVCAYAHGDKVHVRGVITSVTATSITIKAADGKSVDVKLVSSTVYTQRSNNADQPAKAGDLAAGDVVVVHATQTDSGLNADEIKFSVPARPAPDKTPKSMG
jgi:hypothetical protein